MNRKLGMTALALVGGLTLAACGSSTPASNSSSTASSAESSAASSVASSAPSSAESSASSAESPASSASSAPGSSSSGAGGTGDPNLTTTISILAPSYADSSKSDWQAIIAGYNKLYPKVTVKLQIEAWEGFTDKIQTRIQGNDLPDILNDNSYADYVKNKLLYPITDVMSPDTLATIVPSLAKNGVGQDGTQWAAPDIASARIMAYNTDLFKKAGIASPPKTWDEELADAQKIQALGNGIYGYGLPMGKEEAQVEASLWIWGNKGDWADSSGKITANTAVNVAAFDEMKKFIDGKATQPNPGATNRQAVADLFNQGKIGMYVTQPGLMLTTRTKFPAIKYALAAVPSKDGVTPVALGVTDFIVAFNNKDDSRKAATKGFLDYMYSGDVYAKWAAGTGLLPVTTSAIKTGSTANAADKPFYDALPSVKFLPQSNPNWTDLQNALQANGGEIATKSGQETLDDIQAQVDAAG